MPMGCLYVNVLLFMSLQEAQQFVDQFIRGEYTPGEYAAFLQWLKGATVEELTIIADMHESMHGEWVLPEGPSSAWVIQLEQKLSEQVKERAEETVTGDREWGMDGRELVMYDQEGVDREGDDQEGANREAGLAEMQPGRKRRWNVWAAAAAILILLSTGTFIYVHQMRSGSGDVRSREKLLSMTFVNPRGGAQKEMVLADGSKVWLNAGSVLKYPRQFTSSERLVELSGEAFFEVSGNSGSPFRVLIKDAEVEVLGTFFTIMAYDDEPGNRTTVVNGAVKVMSDQQSVTLEPGDQAEVIYASPGVDASPAGVAGAPVVVQSGIDPNLVLAWKGGIYRFKDVELRTVMREVERAYDVTVQYQPNVGNPSIIGSLDLNKSLDAALKQMETILPPNKIHFTQNGKTVIASSI
jgi:ferric-dicitrate binding protein FerR (iron transport regulator)